MLKLQSKYAAPILAGLVSVFFGLPLVKAAQPECQYLTQNQAQTALNLLKAKLPSTPFESAQPSEICGLVRVQLQSGKVAYTEPTGRYLLLAFAFDTERGEPADVSAALDGEIDRRQSVPSNLPPGLFDQ